MGSLLRREDKVCVKWLFFFLTHRHIGFHSKIARTVCHSDEGRISLVLFGELLVGSILRREDKIVEVVCGVSCVSPQRQVNKA